ncbi:hypothetical protein HDU96_010163 [Phlyctochytrium bullatum]|nr:hypothetical protein HDU96_010163 [Phlyctochytrium bullatum]
MRLLRRRLPPSSTTLTLSLRSNHHHHHHHHSPTLIDRIHHDHATITHLFTTFPTNSTSPSNSTATALLRAISAHSLAEEATVHPVLERCLPDGATLAEAARREHYALRRRLGVVEAAVATGVGVREKMEEFRVWFCEHAKHEEMHDLPKLREVLSREDAVMLGDAFEEARAIAMDRPHLESLDTGDTAERLGKSTRPMEAVREAVREAVALMMRYA